jgi:kinetochore protein Mis12/MTW1
VALEAERARNDALLSRLKGVLGVADAVKKEEDGEGREQESLLGFLRDKGTLEQGGSDKPITTTTEFTLSQLSSLRELSESLRTVLPKLDDAQEEEGGPSWRRERAEYVEGASRKYLERVGGLELGPHGDVRDGEWQGGGRALAKGEVESLENVASILSGQHQHQHQQGSSAHEQDAVDES